MLASSALTLSQIIDRQTLTVTSETSVAQVVRLMSETKTSCVVIVQGQKLVGIFTERDVIRLSAAGMILTDTAIATVMSEKIISISESLAENLTNILFLLRQHQIRHLPVVKDNGDLVGLITHQTIRQILEPADLLKFRQVGEVMTTKVIHAPQTTSIFNLTELMTRNRVSCVIIVDDQKGSELYPLGIITERDIVQIQALGINFAETPAATVMTKHLVKILPSEPLWIAHQIMEEQQIRRLVVTSDTGELLGILTQSHLLQMLDPIEMLSAIDALQQVVEARTKDLKITNQQLQTEILERQRAESELQNQLCREQLMVASANRIRQSLNLEEILCTTVQEVQQFLGCDRVLIYRFWSDGTGSVVQEAVNPGWSSIIGQLFSEEVFPLEYHSLYHQGRIRAINNVESADIPPCLMEFMGSFEAKAKIVVPIIQQDELWGLLIAHHCANPREWQSLEIDLLDKLATHIAIALQQSELYEQLQIELLERQSAEEKLSELASLLMRANDELEIKVAARTKELKNTLNKLQNEVLERKNAETKMSKALEKEKELSELKSRFVTMASHEFRTPLATILSSSDLLKRFSHKFTEDKRLEHLNKIQIAVKHMTNLLEDVLLIGKASSLRVDFNPISVNLESFCRNILERVSLTVGKAYNFTFEYQGESSIVQMDKKLLEQMLVNLLENAINYSPVGSLISLHLLCDNMQAIFQIKDQGIGIPEADKEHLFEVFHRGSNIGNVSGTGIGMAIIKNVIEVHGGSITFESEVGMGTIFTICLPISRDNG